MDNVYQARRSCRNSLIRDILGFERGVPIGYCTCMFKVTAMVLCEAAWGFHGLAASWLLARWEGVTEASNGRLFKAYPAISEKAGITLTFAASSHAGTLPRLNFAGSRFFEFSHGTLEGGQALDLSINTPLDHSRGQLPVQSWKLSRFQKEIASFPEGNCLSSKILTNVLHRPRAHRHDLILSHARRGIQKAQAHWHKNSNRFPLRIFFFTTTTTTKNHKEAVQQQQ
jgi:hypothetical protein